MQEAAHKYARHLQALSRRKARQEGRWKKKKLRKIGSGEGRVVRGARR
ncbi:hypothetical protein PUN28_001539 [Cardiocondyla obscurior]|uniref:Uncharacterized protein n=1 Tax=Cardiocondyla obscurior TaxID=286306 RepID=A0AAW2H5H2_9HYME